ncbi:hypothetical protein Y1Q_0011938 [Alligator mississippiensis]|uniref:Uncharacterized protein n=1 Tax=Alligator mississippiensis TaxID=8496 RepID=A0A151NCI3_ALLMI|nr:hypothetical protein Y1Q_0011938 [Alligator mississippiensis]
MEGLEAQSKPRDEREALGDQAESRVGIARQSEIKLSPGEQEQEMHQKPSWQEDLCKLMSCPLSGSGPEIKTPPLNIQVA